MMRIENDFKKAFFLSGMLHFLVLIIFNVNLFSTQAVLKKETRISFYGSFLSESLGTPQKIKEDSASVSSLDKKVAAFTVEKNILSFDVFNYEKETAYLKLDKPVVSPEYDRKTVAYFKDVDAGLGAIPMVNTKDSQSAQLTWYLKNLVLSRSPFSDATATFGKGEKNFNFKIKALISPEGKIEFSVPF